MANGEDGRAGRLARAVASCAGLLAITGALPGATWAQAPARTLEESTEGAAASTASSARTPEPSPWSAPEPWRTDRLYFQTSVYTLHFDRDPDHVNTQWLVNLDYRFDKFWAGGQWLIGGAAFVNSFGQWSEYVYGGWLARPIETLQPFYVKLTAGLLHGYKAPYDEKIPFNKYGVAPAILPMVGYCFYDRFCSELIFFGTAGAMLTLGFTMP